MARRTTKRPLMRTPFKVERINKSGFLGTTHRQNEALAFLRTYRMRNATYPSLEERGHIRRIVGRSRAIEIIEHDHVEIVFENLALPTALQAQLSAYCEANAERPADVIADAIMLHLDELEAKPSPKEGLLAAANRLVAEQSAVLARARHIAMYLAVLMTGASLATVGRAFGDRDHTTVMAARDKIASQRSHNVNFDAELGSLEAEIRANQLGSFVTGICGFWK